MASTSSIEIANTSESTQETNTSPVIPFVFDGSYKGDDLTKRVREILNLPEIKGWTIVDTCDELAMVHYDDNADMTIYGHLRGVLVDTESGSVIADSFGYTPTAVTSELTTDNDVISVCDQEGVCHSFPVDDVTIKRVFEGVVIRAIWHKSKLFLITHRKINPVRSRWGPSKSFITLYTDAKGPTAEQLFDVTKPYSSTCYDFLVVDESLLVGTRQKVTSPYLVCLAQRTMDIKRPVEEVAPGVSTFETNEHVSGSITEPVILNPKKLTIAEANKHLKFGYYNEFTVGDPRQLTGEAVIMYRMENGSIKDIVKVHSPSYEWRVVMRGNNPNIANQFYSMLNIAYPEIKEQAAWDTFKQKLILFPLYDEQSLKDLYSQTKAILTIPEGTTSRMDYNNKDSRIHLLWMNYVLSLPSSMQGDGLELLSQFKNDRDQVIEWIQNIESSNKDIETADVHVRVKGIISSSRRLARDRVAGGNNFSARGTRMNLPLLIKSTIRNLIHKENGPSLYGLVREMKRSRTASSAPTLPANTEMPSVSDP
jgi:hypothetical protein